MLITHEMGYKEGAKTAPKGIYDIPTVRYISLLQYCRLALVLV